MIVITVLIFCNPISVEDVKWFIDSGAKNQINRIEQVIDSNSDGIIQSEEIKNAKSRALLFDADNDGALSTDELGKPFDLLDIRLRTSNLPTMVDRDGNQSWSVDELDSLSEILIYLDTNLDGQLDSIELDVTLKELR